MAAAGQPSPYSLTAGTVSRTSDTNAAIGFTTSQAGTAYYLVLNSGAAAPASAAVKTAHNSLGAVAAGTVSNKAVTLTAGHNDIYVVVENAAGNISQPLKIAAAAYWAFRVSGSGNTYMSLEEAVANVPANGIVTMLRDVTVSGTVAFDSNNKTYTLDLGGYTMSHDVLALNNGTVTIKNGTINATVRNRVNSGSVTIESGTYIGGNDAIYSGGGAITIVSGQFSCTTDNSNDGCIAAPHEINPSPIVLAAGSQASVTPWQNNPAVKSVTVTTSRLIYTAVQVGGEPGGIYRTYAIQITFNQPVTGLSRDNITIKKYNGETGTATRSPSPLPSGTSTTWTVDLTSPVTQTEGYVWLEISDFGGYEVQTAGQLVWVYMTDGISIKTPPAKLTYTHGEALDLTGLVATIRYKDGTTKDVALADFGANNITIVLGTWQSSVEIQNGEILSAATYNGKSIIVMHNGSGAVIQNLTVTP